MEFEKLSESWFIPHPVQRRSTAGPEQQHGLFVEDRSYMTFRNDDTVEVQGSTVNIRQGASTSSRIISTVKRGDKLEVIEKTGSWYQIKTESGRTGWVHSSLVK